MNRSPTKHAVLAAIVVTAIALHASAQVAAFEQTFQSPPDDARLMMRWWWFGPAVTRPELQLEMEQMHAVGIGGFEIQPVYPIALDQTEGLRNLPYLSSEFLDDLRFVNNGAQKLGLRVSLTLASGWPYGGPHTPITEAAGALRTIRTEVAPDVTSIAQPALENGETMLAAFLTPSVETSQQQPAMLPLPAVPSTRVEFPANPQARTILWFISSRTGQQVKRAAVGAEGFVLDHFSRAAADDHLHSVADTLMTAFPDQPPYSVFSDSLEVYGSDWTPNLPAEFARRRGYDILPHLAQLVSGTDDEALSVRHDWGKTLTELVEENYLKPIDDWASAHHTLFRSQTYGEPAVALSSNALVALPEGEGPQWKQFSYTRWASSANHLYSRNITSAETWTWLHSPAFRATPLDMKAEADRFFLQGVNQLVGHGWPYSPSSAGEPGWRFYAAGAFNTHNPWWMVMPDIALYLQRTSWILRQGKPANDVAIYLPQDDAYAAFTPGKVSLSDLMPRWITPALTASIEDSGYNFDYIDAAAIATHGIPYPVLILPDVDRIEPATLARIASYQRQGGKVVAVGRLPAHAPGLTNFSGDSAKVQAAARDLFSSPANSAAAARYVSSPADLPSALNAMLTPDMQLAQPAPEVGFLHRKLEQSDIYFIANTGNRPVHTHARFRTRYHSAEWLDADSGAVRPVRYAGELALDLEPYASRILLLRDGPELPAGADLPSRDTVIADLSHDWQVSFNENAPSQPLQMHELASWTNQPAERYYSGVATYRKSFNLPTPTNPATRLILSFGEGESVVDTSTNLHHPGMRALLDPPIREAAEIYINGKRVGSLWHPPYELDISRFLKPGSNQLEVRVADTAINELAGQSGAVYRLLNQRYGERFTPQDMENLQPLPSGLLGPVKLLSRSTP